MRRVTLLSSLRALALVAGLGFLTGVLWSSAISRVGPALSPTEVFSPAQGGSELLRNLSERYVGQTPSDGRIALMPFQPLLWGERRADQFRVDRLEARVFIPGLTHIDVVFGADGPDRAIFRLSRHPNVPSEIVRRQWGHTLLRFPASGEWTVPEATVAPERRAQLVQANYRLPHRTFETIAEEFAGRWFDVAVEREGDTVRAWVDGALCAEAELPQMPRGYWGLAGGDLPHVFVDHIALQGERESEDDEWEPFAFAWDFGSDWARATPWAARAGLCAVPPLVLASLLTLLGWLVAPGAGLAGWLTRAAACLLPALAFALPRFHPSPQPHTLIATAWGALALGVLIFALQLVTARTRWRARPDPLPDRDRWHPLSRRWRIVIAIGAVLLGAQALMLSATARLLRDRFPVPSAHMAPRFPEGRDLIRGDLAATLHEDLGDLDARLTVRALEPATSIEVLLRLGHHHAHTLQAWHALRLSTEPGQSGRFRSDTDEPPVPIEYTLPVDASVEIHAQARGDMLTVTADGETVAEWRDRAFGIGAIGGLVRGGHARATALDVWAKPVDSLSAHAQAPWLGDSILGWAVLAALIALLAVPVLAWLLAGWTRVTPRGTVGWIAGVAAASLLTWVGAIWWYHWTEPGVFELRPLFALGLALTVAVVGIYAWVAAHWARLRRRAALALLLVVALVTTLEMTVRGTAWRWQLITDLQTGRHRGALLMRPVLAPLLWEVAIERFRGRRFQPLPRPDDSRVVRVFCLGGSSTYGSGVADPVRAWPSILEDRLDEDHGLNAEVFNYGFPSLTSLDDLLLLRAGLAEREPDWVVLTLGGNEAVAPAGNPPPQRAQWESIRSSAQGRGPLRRLAAHSRLMVGLSRWLRGVGRSPAESHTQPQVPPEDLRTTLDEILDLAEEHSFRVALIAEPTWESVVFDQPYHQRWIDELAATGAARGAVFIDPRPAFWEQISAHVWATWIHQTWRGSDLMAEAVAAPLAAAIADPVRVLDPEAWWRAHPDALAEAATRLAEDSWRLDVGDESYEALGPGWHPAEVFGGDHPFRWTSRLTSTVFLPLEAPVEGPLTFRATTFATPSAPPQEVSVWVNGTEVGRVSVEPEWRIHRLELPPGLWREGINRLDLRQDHVISPHEVSGSLDRRPLGVGVDWVQLEQGPGESEEGSVAVWPSATSLE